MTQFLLEWPQSGREDWAPAKQPATAPAPNIAAKPKALDLAVKDPVAIFLFKGNVQMRSGDQVLKADSLLLNLFLANGQHKHIEAHEHKGQVRVQCNGNVYTGDRFEIDLNGQDMALGGLLAMQHNFSDATNPAASRPAGVMDW